MAKIQGFDVVEYRIVTSENLEEAVQYFSEAVERNDFPSDGLVAIYDDIAYGDSLGSTSKFPRNSYAFKWADETRETVLKEMEWSPSRTGLINPVAIFEPVELEGTTVSRASVHNISILKELQHGHRRSYSGVQSEHDYSADRRESHKERKSDHSRYLSGLRSGSQSNQRK